MDGPSAEIGQTGSAKVSQELYDCRGVNARAIELLFKLCKERRDRFDCSVTVSCVEIHNDAPLDVLVEPSVYAQQKPLQIREDSQGRIVVPELSEHTVDSAESVLALLHSRAHVNCRRAATHHNEHSSRSHCCTFLTVKCRSILRPEDETTGRCVLVDLSGSERQAKSSAAPLHSVEQSRALASVQTEARYINRSLAALGDVLQAMQNKDKHIVRQANAD